MRELPVNFTVKGPVISALIPNMKSISEDSVIPTTANTYSPAEEAEAGLVLRNNPEGSGSKQVL